MPLEVSGYSGLKDYRNDGAYENVNSPQRHRDTETQRHREEGSLAKDMPG